MAVPSPDEGILPGLREDGGFWLPNSVIDVHARHLGARGLYVYCVLARATSHRHYPNVSAIASMTGLSARSVRALVGQLHGFGLLNDHDLAHIGGSSDNGVGNESHDTSSSTSM